jgi:hypothetical protein
MKDYAKNLASLRARRLDPIENQILTKVETYEQRGKTIAIKYTLGAMQEVDPSYTKISVDEATRVFSTLEDGLDTAHTPVSMRLQGSVPLNTHIKGVSDIDLLCLHSYLTAEIAPQFESKYIRYGTPMVETMRPYRKSCENVLQNRYHAATVDIGGAKSIKLSGGSLKRRIDVVPACWNDTARYQSSNRETDRAVNVYDKLHHQLIKNHPFYFMAAINIKDNAMNGGAKKIIRLLKNIKNDSEVGISLSSYEIASLVWHFDISATIWLGINELALLAYTQFELARLIADETKTKQLLSPDGSRRILDEDKKYADLCQLYIEVTELAQDVALELSKNKLMPTLSPIDISIARSLLKEAVV